jgi:hypothetical protein
MKKKAKILTLFAALAACSVSVAHADAPPDPTTYTIVLAGSSTQNSIRIWLTPDGYSYVIDSAAPLEGGGTICQNAPENPSELLCQAPMVGGFLVNAGPKDDRISVAADIDLPVAIHAGSGNDYIRGGAGPDKLIGGPGEDRLIGGGGADFLSGGPGNDVLLGGFGDDILIRGPGSDVLRGGSGNNSIRPFPSKPGTP